MIRFRPHILAAATLIVIVLIALCLLAPYMYPLHTDTPANFWYAATAVDLGAARKRDDFIIVDRDRLIYSREYPFAVYPDYPYETISLETAAADFPAVQHELAKRATHNDPADYFAAGYSQWAAVTHSTGTIYQLLLCIDQARTQYVAQSGPAIPAPHYNTFQNGLLHVAQTARLYWATFLFEACLFSGLILFAFWPYVHRATLRRKFLHIALIPFLLYLPMWFGYCNSASPAYPVGGILYPYFNLPTFALFDNFDWEFALLAKLPSIFSVITQGRTITFNEYFDRHATVPYQLGPVNVAALSALLTLLVACCHAFAWLNQKRRKSSQGFSVLETNAPH